MNEPRSRRRRGLALALLAMAAVAAGCGESVDSEQMEKDITADFAKGAGFEPSEFSVDCPDGEDAEEGNEFDCTLTAPNGDDIVINVTITEGGDSFEAVVPPQQQPE